MRRLAVFLPNWVGDAVMATPTLRALHHRFGAEAEIIGILRPRIAETLAGTPWLHTLWTRDDPDDSPRLDWRGYARRLAATGVDASVHLTNDFASALAARLGRVAVRVGYARNRRGWLLTTALAAPRRAGRWLPVSAMDYYLALADALGCPRDDRGVELATTGEDERAADRAWRAAGLARDARPVVINSSGAFGSAKLWPERSCAALARRVAVDLERPVVILAGPDERSRALRIAASAGHPHVAALAGAPLSIGLSKAVVRRAAALVSTDSGPRHFGAAFGVPVVALFGPTDPAWSDTRHDREIRLVHSIDCRPCAKRECPFGHHACMERLEVDDVCDALVRALRGERRRSPPGAPIAAHPTVSRGAAA